MAKTATKDKVYRDRPGEAEAWRKTARMSKLAVTAFATVGEAHLTKQGRKGNAAIEVLRAAHHLERAACIASGKPAPEFAAYIDEASLIFDRLEETPIPIVADIDGYSLVGTLFDAPEGTEPLRLRKLVRGIEAQINRDADEQEG